MFDNLSGIIEKEQDRQAKVFRHILKKAQPTVPFLPAREYFKKSIHRLRGAFP